MKYEEILKLIEKDPLAGALEFAFSLTEAQTKLSKDVLEKLKKHTLKVIGCVQYIEENINNIATWIETKEIPYKNRNDRKNGVLRDHFGTSFHIGNFKNGKEAKDTLSEYIDNVKGAILAVYKEEKLIDFIKEFKYDKNTGCLEARTEKALFFAAGLHATNLDIEMQNIAQDFTENVAANYQAVYQHFESLLGQVMVYNRQDIILTKQVLDEYMEMLGQDLNEVAEIKSEVNLKDLFDSYKNEMTETLGNKGMVQVSVKNIATAKKLEAELKKHPSLLNTEINKCRIENTKDNKFMFRLTEKQYNIIFGGGSYDDLKPVTLGDISILYDTLEQEVKKKNNPKFLEEIVKSNKNALDSAVFYKRENHLLLSLAVIYQSEQAVLALIEKLSKDTIRQLSVFKVGELNTNLLLFLIKNYQEAAFVKMLEKLEPADVDAVLKQGQINTVHALLFGAAVMLNEDAFMMLVNKASRAAINESVLIKDKEQVTAFYATALKQSEKAFINLINKLDDAVFKQAMTMKDNFGRSYFDLICSSQAAQGLITVINKLSDQTFAANLLALQDNSLGILLDKVQSSEELKNIIFTKLTAGNTVLFLKRLENLPQHEFSVIQSIYLRNFINNKLGKSSPEEINVFTTSKGNKVELNNPNILQVIHDEGFASYGDAECVIKNCSFEIKPGLIDLIKELEYKKLLLKGGMKNYIQAPALDKTVQDKIENFEILYKVIARDNFDKYIAQFKDYNYRPDDLRIKKPNATHKFHHLSGEIKEYQPKNKKQPPKQRIKKNSTTLLSPSMLTPVFGEQYKNAKPLVGLLFDCKKTTIKAMFEYDRGTHAHEWVGTEAEVKAYKDKISKTNYTDFEKFKKDVKTNQRMNEVLAEIPKEAIIGVFMRNTSYRSHKTALLYATKIQQELGIDIPVYHYDRNERAIIPYPKERLKERTLDLAINAAKELRADLLKDSYQIRFFGGKQYQSPDKAVNKELPKTAWAIVSEIDKILAQEDKSCLLDKLPQYAQMLKQNYQSNIKRVPTTANSYKEAYIKLTAK